MNKIACSSQNTAAKTLPADVCIFGCFGRLSPAAIYSANCWFASGVKWWIHASSIVIYLCKIFLLHWNSCKQCSESLTHCFWSTVSKRGTHFEHSFLIDKCSYKMVNSLPLISSTPLLSHTISIYDWSKRVCGVFWCSLEQLLNLGDLSIQHICVCVNIFKISIPPLKDCFQWSRVRITLIKPLLSLNSIFFSSESNALSRHKIQIFPLFWKFATVASLE